MPIFEKLSFFIFVFLGLDSSWQVCYMYLYDDGYGVMGINAQAVESNLSSDPGYYGSDPV